jgi:hypothetical protein
MVQAALIYQYELVRGKVLNLYETHDAVIITLLRRILYGRF